MIKFNCDTCEDCKAFFKIDNAMRGASVYEGECRLDPPRSPKIGQRAGYRVVTNTTPGCSRGERTTKTPPPKAKKACVKKAASTKGEGKSNE
jgi:hypothetical protein